MIDERIKFLREQRGMTQAELAKQLNITRSSVNAWELGISIPSSRSLIQLASIFDTSTDFLLGIDKNPVIQVSGLSENQILLLHGIIHHLRNRG